MKFIADDQREDKDNKYIYYQEGHPSIILNRGAEAFEKCVEILSNTTPKNELQFHSSLNLLIPENKYYWTKREYLLNLISLKKSELKNSEINAFHFDIGSEDAEISLIVQLVDDNSFNGIRRANLLNEKYKYVGITHKETDNLFFV